MSADARSVADLSPWLTAMWLWLPALGGLAVFGGAAVLQFGSGTAVFWWALAGVACAGAYAARERVPVVSLIVSLLVVAAARLPEVGVLRSGFDVVYLLLLCVPVLPLMAVASRLSPRRSALALLVTVATTVAVSPDPPWSTPAPTAQATLVEYVLNLGVPVMVALGAWLAGSAMLARQRSANARLERAASLERTRHAEAARVLAEERSRIARELHDVVTHTVAVMVVQAAAADAVWDRDPQQARASLRAVEEAGRVAMTDLHGMLNAMRADDAAAERRSQGSLEQLPDLVEQIRSAGLSGRLAVTGSPAEVATAASLSLLRIAQEAVTNGLRHARASTIGIDLVVGADAVRLSVTDDGVGCEATRRGADPDDAARHGVVGMRERAHLIGGRLEIGPGPAGGTVVSVAAPLQRDEQR